MSNSNFFKTLRVDPKETAYLDRQTASNGDIAYDKEVKTLRVFDGTTKGGAALSRADLVNVTTNTFRVKSTESKLATVTYTVTITGPQGADTGNKYNLNGVYRPIPNFVVGYTYVFIQDDQTNVYFPNANGTTINQHPLNFSADNLSGNNGGGTSYLVDVRYFLDSVSVTQAVYNSSAFNTAVSRQVWITVTNATPAVLYYWCWNHTAMGNSIAVADPGSGTGTGGVSVEDSVPTTTDSGSLWLDTNTGILYVYYDDGTSGQWIQPTFPYPDVTNLATISSLSAVATSGNYSDLVNAPSQFALSVAADDSTQISISSGETIQFIGAGGVTTTADADGTITITGGATTGNVTFSTTTIDSSDSSAIIFTPAVVMESDLTVQNDLTVNTILLTGSLITQGSGTPEIISDNEIYITPGTTTILNGLTTFYETTEVINTKTGATGTVVHDFSTGAVFYHSSLSANFTANFTNVPTTNNRTIAVVLILSQGATGYYPSAVQIAGVAQTILWQGALLPSGTANRIDVVSFTLIRTGSVWTVIGALTTYGAP
jgi:hypothetical protein